MQLKKFPLLISTAALLLGACSLSQPTLETAGPVYLTPTATAVLPIFQTRQQIVRQQLLSVHYAGAEHQVMALLQAEGSTIRLSILSPLGIRLYDAVYERGDLSITTLLAVEKLPPARQVLFDIMLTLLPAGDIAPVLPPGWHIADADNMRTICAEDGTLIYSIAFRTTPQGAAAPARLQQLIFDYEIVFTDLN